MFIIVVLFRKKVRSLFKSESFDIKIYDIANESQINEMAALIENSKTKEITMQEFFANNPEILSPLQIIEIQREFRLIKRDQIRNLILLDANNNNRVDFMAVKIQPNATPVIIEMKAPNANILDHDSLRLSKISEQIIHQLHIYLINFIRKENIEHIKDKYNWSFSDNLSKRVKKEISLFKKVSNSMLNDILSEIEKNEIQLLAIIGRSNEFSKNNIRLLEDARKMFYEKGITLVTYDEILEANILLIDYLKSDSSLIDYFRSGKSFNLKNGVYANLKKKKIVSDEIYKNIQKSIYQNNSNVIVYGFGIPSCFDAAYQTPYHFNINSIADPPKFLGGSEKLLWAGRFSGKWVVVKKRLTEPGTGLTVLYEFYHPIERDSTITGIKSET